MTWVHFTHRIEIFGLEKKIPEDIPCLQLLLLWNSAKGEGFGSTHNFVAHKLRHIGRSDLADWLSTTVFKQLGLDLQKDIDELLKRDKEKKRNRY